MWRLLCTTCNDFIEDECPRFAAALAYYAIFSLPALLLLVISLAGLFVGNSEAAKKIGGFFREFMVARVAEQITSQLELSGQLSQGWQSGLGAVMLLVGATGVLGEVQTALNKVWRVAPDPQQGGWRSFFWKRLLSLLMVAAMSLLLLLSLVASWFLAATGAWAKTTGLESVSSPLFQILEHAVSLGLLSLFFAAAIRFLPDVRLDWSDVALGGLITALLFAVGKTLLCWYLAWSDPTTPFGATGSLALVLVWIYYSAMIFLFGAEFTKVYADWRGKRVLARAGAKREPEVDSQAK
ncbi:MAG: YihY/virulence factor BrkB family protein [Pirellulaceae bacterium]